jgi:hypothetical protein
MSAKTCDWKYDGSAYFFESSCGGAWLFEYEFEVDEDHRFCMKCGRPINLIPPEPEPDEEEGDA